jgi:hypothetical protein
MGTTDAVKDDVYTFAREAVHFFHEVLLLVINGESAQVGNGGRPSRGTGSVHLQPGEAPQLHECRADSPCRAVNEQYPSGTRA